MQKPTNTALVSYHAPRSKYAKLPTTSIDPIGIDTEADTTGRCFMICTSVGDIWTPDQLPGCLFDRQHRDRSYVAYNLKYDMGAILQHLSRDDLETLRTTGNVTVNEYRYRVIANKMLGITRGHKSINVYDMYNYYGGSLQHNAEKYLGESKLESDVKNYTVEYIQTNWHEIAKYCIMDSVIVKRLADRLITQLNSWGLHVRKLYSTAHVSYAWFSAKCGHPSVGYFWRWHRRVLDYAMEAYNGGKFEVTTRGRGYYYEYDLVSAYPYSISRLVDLDTARVVYSATYRKSAVYGFLNVTADIPAHIYSPVAIKRALVNTYPMGTINKIITKLEYEYLIANNIDVTIRDAVWIHVDKRTYPYRDEINRLVALKQSIDKTADPMQYQTIKILLNSLYGKFVQLIEKPEYWQAGASWNPIYASVITAETRVRISQLQQQYPSVCAVHTDSVISDKPLPFGETDELGALSYECEGDGLIAGCGIYQIGGKTALRGVPSPTPLIDLARASGSHLRINRTRANTWRQVLANNWPTSQINQFVETTRKLRVDADKKRIWIDDAERWSELLDRQFISAPLIYSELLYGTNASHHS